MGAAETDNHNCATTWPGYKRPTRRPHRLQLSRQRRLRGRADRDAAESPSVPGDFVGLPEGTTTGRYLLAYLCGVGLERSPEVATASLSGRGPGRAARPRLDQFRSWLLHAAASAFLIPVQPLQPLDRLRGDRQLGASSGAVTEQKFSLKPGTNPLAENPSTPARQKSAASRGNEVRAAHCGSARRKTSAWRGCRSKRRARSQSGGRESAQFGTRAEKSSGG